MMMDRLYVKERAKESGRIKELETKLIGAFEEEFGTLLCTPIRERYFHPERKCKAVVLKTSEMLEDLLKRNPPACPV
jgi:hypothetical protein